LVIFLANKLARKMLSGAFLCGAIYLFCYRWKLLFFFKYLYLNNIYEFAETGMVIAFIGSCGSLEMK